MLCPQANICISRATPLNTASYNGASLTGYFKTLIFGLKPISPFTVSRKNIVLSFEDPLLQEYIFREFRRVVLQSQ